MSSSYFSVVVSDAKIVAEGELPPTWGLLAVRGSKLVCLKDAPPLRDVTGRKHEPIARGFVVAMLRAGGAVPQAEADEIRAARAEGREAGMKASQGLADSAKAAFDELLARVRAFEKESGLEIGGRSWRERDPAEVGALVRSVLEGDERADRAVGRVTEVQRQLREAADALETYVVAPQRPLFGPESAATP